ncbi:hypothetical protein AA0Z99_11315 [Agrococcus sp. 1P02AA]|uniref:hypothetical protein n=1 Tax=Agrococcus sp. 1P02AA TaxID=3132259 RepID=UPI0039A5E161
MADEAGIPRRRTQAFQDELDALIDELDQGSVTIRSSWRWQLWSALAGLGALVVPAAVAVGAAMRLVDGDERMLWPTALMGAIAAGILWLEAVLVAKMVRGEPSLTLTREGFALRGGQTVSWLHVRAVTASAKRSRLRGQEITAYLEPDARAAVERSLPRSLRVLLPTERWIQRLQHGRAHAALSSRFLTLLTHPAVSADVVADLASFLALRARD